MSTWFYSFKGARDFSHVVAITALSRARLLPAPSVLRPAKIATIDASYATKLGTISAAMIQQVLDRVGRTLGMSMRQS
jgi:hypothetical protein